MKQILRETRYYHIYFNPGDDFPFEAVKQSHPDFYIKAASLEELELKIGRILIHLGLENE